MTGRTPTFEVDQPDNTRVTVDLGAPGEMGDFAFRVTGVGRGRGDYFSAYHLYEAEVFADVLLSLTRDRNTAEVLRDVQRIRHEVDVIAEGRDRTDTAENNFEHHLPVLREPTADRAGDVGGEYLTGGRGSGTLAVSLSPTGLAFTVRSAPEPDGERSVTIPITDLSRFAAGMVWRSYADDGMSLSRLSTDAYDTALDAFEQSLQSQ